MVNDWLIVASTDCPVPLSPDATLPTPVVTISEPAREAAAVGANPTLTVQLAPAASEDGQVVETKLKSVPLTDAAVGTVMLRAAAPVLLRVAASVELAPMATLPNARPGLIVTPASAVTVCVKLACDWAPLLPVQVLRHTCVPTTKGLFDTLPLSADE